MVEASLCVCVCVIGWWCGCGVCVCDRLVVWLWCVCVCVIGLWCVRVLRGEWVYQRLLSALLSLLKTAHIVSSVTVQTASLATAP